MWKDVDGVLSADPREIDNTAVLEFLTFEEATELAYFGAQVLHPQSMRPAMDKDGLRRVRSLFTLVPIRPRRRGARRSLRNFVPVAASLRPHHGFNPDANTSTPFNSI